MANLTLLLLRLDERGGQEGLLNDAHPFFRLGNVSTLERRAATRGLEEAILTFNNELDHSSKRKLAGTFHLGSEVEDVFEQIRQQEVDKAIRKIEDEPGELEKMKEVCV